MNLDALFADLEASFAFASNQAERSSRERVDRHSPKRMHRAASLEISVTGHTFLLEPGLIARNFVAGIWQVNSRRIEIRAMPPASQVLMIVPFGSLEKVIARPTLIGHPGEKVESSGRALARLSLVDYLHSWIETTIYIKPRATTAFNCTLLAVKHHYLFASINGSDVLIPLAAIEWLALPTD